MFNQAGSDPTRMSGEDTDTNTLQPFRKMTGVYDNGKLGLAIGSYRIVFLLLKVQVIQVNCSRAFLHTCMSKAGYTNNAAGSTLFQHIKQHFCQ